MFRTDDHGTVSISRVLRLTYCHKKNNMGARWKKCVFSIILRNYGVCLRYFYGENMVNLITRMVSMEIVWRKCGDLFFYGDFMIELSWRCVYGENMIPVNRITK